ncbi:MAG TPA: L,D-transpeptidase family protein [Verrucomicrobiae bacterium]|jgi:D-alanyl-D-alanine dipeptidase|nr:L,D-transpeptidase family protein [Verrucomicrobiae bacterium]
MKSRLSRFLLTCLLLVGSSFGQQSSPLKSSNQLIVVITPDWYYVEGYLQRYERAGPRTPWKAVGNSITVVVGKNGLGWGAGIVRADVHAGDPIKKEGDGKAPAGIFRLSTAFGYAPQEKSGWTIPYVPLTPTVECVDDTNSKFYNRVLDRGTVAPDWNSSEHMLRDDELYRWGIVVDHNTRPTKPGGGSCIFVHIWRGRGQGTVGCTAMPQEELEAVLAWLDPRKEPLLVQLPLLQYRTVRTRWKLPAPFIRLDFK